MSSDKHILEGDYLGIPLYPPTGDECCSLSGFELTTLEKPLPYSQMLTKKTRNDKSCCYDYSVSSDTKSPAQSSESTVATPAQSLDTVSFGSTHDALSFDATISFEVMRIIYSTEQSIEDLSARYFDGLHRWVQFYCRDRFGKDLVQYNVAPTAEFSLLLLCMCLITYDPVENASSLIPHDALYFHAKTLFAQVQVLRHPSMHLIQAGTFLSMYEYAHGHSDAALASIDICARLAYKLGLNKKPTRLGWSESWNMWWALVVFERIYYCESSLTHVPLITIAPEETDFLPHEVGDCNGDPNMNPGFRITPVTRAGVGCYGRAAQAAYLLDRVIQTVKTSTHISTSDQIATLIFLDGELQRLLSVTMNKCHGKRAGHCGAVGTSIRFVTPKFSLRYACTSKRVPNA